MTCKGCGSNITSGPKPYYEEVKENVVQSHETVIEKHVHAVGIRILDPWNVPGENLSVTVRIENVAVLPVGSYLYNPQYGYFLISQWNPKSQQVGVVHAVIAGTAAAGTFVPALTPFLVVPKPCCSDDEASFLPFVDADFTAPFTNNVATIEVTSTFGLRIGEYLRMGSAVYRLDEIKSTREIVIFNQGAGFPGGSTVSARDDSGDRQYLLVSEAAYVCAVGVTTTEGKLIICDGADQKIITGSSAGQVPVLLDPTTGLISFANLGAITIADEGVTTSKLADHSVTEIKIAADAVTQNNIANASIVNSKIASNAVSTNQLIDLSVTTIKLADSSVTTAKIAAGAVDAGRIADGQVTSSKLSLLAVSTGILQNNAVTTTKIADLNVTSAKIADNAIVGAKISDTSITNAKLVDGTITNAKIATGTIINANIANSTIEGHSKIAPDSLTGFNILDASLANEKLGGLPNGSTTTLAVIGTPNIDPASTHTCKTWIWGPWVIVRFDFNINFTGAATTVDFDMPVAPYTAEGGEAWIGNTVIDSFLTTLAATKSYVQPLTGGSARLRITTQPGTVSSSDNLAGQAWCIYPSRSRDTGAEA